MHVVVPLAGPDFVRADGCLKAMIPINGKPFLRLALESRPWANLVTDYSFVLFDCEETREFVAGPLREWFPNASITFLSNYTRGAALSALAGLVSSRCFFKPLIIDLADILYTSDLDPSGFLSQEPECGGIALTFSSSDPAYSYLRIDEHNRVVEAAEKRVISEKASAGTYVFRDFNTYLRALCHAVENEESQTFRDLFFVCPLFNGVLHQGKRVLFSEVENVIDVKVSVRLFEPTEPGGHKL